MDVSIIIVNYNTREITRDCLASVYEQTVGIEFEVILVDNASGDGSAEMVREEFPQVELIANPENRGFAAANNQGMARARGGFILLLNSDTIVLENAVAQAVNFARQHPAAAVVGCRVLNRDGSLQPTCFRYPRTFHLLLGALYLNRLFPRNRVFGHERLGAWARDDVREVEVVTGCFMLVRRRALDQVGLMDESFFMYGEETDWCYRFRRAGWKLLFTPAARIIHLGGASSKKNPAMLLHLRGSILRFVRKHRSGLQYRLSCLLVSLFFALRTPFWFLAALLRRTSRPADLRVARTYARGAICALKGSEALCQKI